MECMFKHMCYISNIQKTLQKNIVFFYYIMAATDFSRFCTPAQLYLILAGISLLSAFFNNFQVITLVVNGIFVLIWGWILNWLCSKGLKTISWILVLLPFILFFFTFFFTKDIVNNAVHAEGFCSASDITSVSNAFDALKMSLSGNPKQSAIDSALTTFKSVLESIEPEPASPPPSSTTGGM